MIVLLLPKGGGDYRGIGLLDPFWKVVEKIMVCVLGACWGTEELGWNEGSRKKLRGVR